MLAMEYGVNVTNKFGFLTDDEAEDPDVVLKRAEASTKKGEKSTNQKKASKVTKKKKELCAATVAVVKPQPAQVVDPRRGMVTTVKKEDGNKENFPMNERGRNRGRGRVMGYRGRGGFGEGFRGGFDNFRGNFSESNVRGGFSDAGREGFDQVEVPINDAIGERFGENRGRPRARGFRPSRGGFRAPRRGGFDSFGGFAEPPADEVGQVAVERGVQNVDNVIDSFRGLPYRGGFRGLGVDRGGVRRRQFRGRQFDRSSGMERTGVKPVDKRDGFGKGNWGTDKDELAAKSEPIGDVNDEESKIEKTDEPPVLQEKTEEEKRQEAEEEAISKQLTLDEFRAQMAPKRTEPQFNFRKAGEGYEAVDAVKLVPLTKDAVDDTIDEEIVIVRREPKAKRLDIEINFTDEQRGRGGGRARDGFRGRGFRNTRADVRDHRQANIFEVSADAFPALGTPQ